MVKVSSMLSLYSHPRGLLINTTRPLCFIVETGHRRLHKKKTKKTISAEWLHGENPGSFVHMRGVSMYTYGLPLLHMHFVLHLCV